MKKILAFSIGIIMSTAIFVGCGGSKGSDTSISVISREEGSGTRGAFIELFKIEEKDSSGEKIDNTVETAEITNSTAVMMTTISGNTNAIGYVSLGSLNDTVKSVDIDGSSATSENIKNGTYKVARPFNIAVKDDISDVAKDFISYILSDLGQYIVENAGYISAGIEGTYTSSDMLGKIVIAGSSSVTPVMEKLKEGYNELNPNVVIEIQQNDSTTGITSVVEGACDIGMASRELKDSEIEKGVTPVVIAIDGIAVIVNNENTVSDMTSEQVKSVFTGEITEWSEINK